MTFPENTRERTGMKSQVFWFQIPRSLACVWSSHVFIWDSNSPLQNHLRRPGWVRWHLPFTWRVSLAVWSNKLLCWPRNRSAWQSWAPFPRNPFPVCFWFGRPAWDIHVGDWEQKGSSSRSWAHTRWGWSADAPIALSSSWASRSSTCDEVLKGSMVARVCVRCNGD